LGSAIETENENLNFDPEREPFRKIDPQCPLYKYTTWAAAKAIIENSSLKLSIPQAFNDPFDILLEEALGAEVEDFLRDLMPAFFELVSGDLDFSRLRPGPMRDKIMFINVGLNRLSSEQLAEHRSGWVSQHPESIWSIPSLRAANEQVVGVIRLMNSNEGIFCSSANKDSLLMWSHYADHHRGVVLELRPDIETDSALLASRPVRYSNERPLLYRSARDLLEKSLFMSPEDSARAIVEPLIYTKSTEWAYEAEYRLAIPRFVPFGLSAEYLTISPGELAAIYFGCRMTAPQRTELKQLARTFNPNIRFHRGVLAKRDYALDWIADDE
jgi:Protein of unknown function (DUF2971)